LYLNTFKAVHNLKHIHFSLPKPQYMFKTSILSYNIWRNNDKNQLQLQQNIIEVSRQARRAELDRTDLTEPYCLNRVGKGRTQTERGMYHEKNTYIMCVNTKQPRERKNLH